MLERIVHSSEPITLVGGATVNHDLLLLAMQHGGKAVCADGGALTVLQAGIVPEAVIGDLDSLPDDIAAQIPSERVHKVNEQDSTDFEKCLARVEAPVIIGVGFSGGRLDHELAALNALTRNPDQRVVLLGEVDIVFLAPPSLRIDLPTGSRISLFPMGAVEGISEGLEWSINGLNFAPDGKIGTSNRVNGEVMISVTAPKMLVILPRAALVAVLAAFAAQPVGWPVRATPHKAPQQR